MLLFTCQTGYITRNPSNIHKVNNVIVCHLALLGGKGLGHLKRHMVMLKDAMFNNKVILNYILILCLDYHSRLHTFHDLRARSRSDLLTVV